MGPTDVSDIRPVALSSALPGRGGRFYVRIAERGGRVWHDGPWLSLYAVTRLAVCLWDRFRYEGRLMPGDGDRCPIFPEHGIMYVIQGSDPPMQWCPHSAHAGRPGKDGPPMTRAKWPLYGIEEAVAAYNARIDYAIKQAGLPDLSDLEVT